MTDKAIISDKLITFTDFLTQYEGQRAEWHAGEVVPKVTNNTRHNLIQGFLYQLLSMFLDLTDMGQVILAGVPMYIDDDSPAREPDLMILLNENSERLKARHLEGAVDIAIEIVSPGSDSIDRGTKFVEYESAGVREYWLIDPLRNEAIIYALNDEGRYQRIASTQLTSHILPQFSLDTALLWQEKLPNSIAILEL
ncbi:MAG: Uma2 family endonuclease, partial [Chloroflexota bacterium]